MYDIFIGARAYVRIASATCICDILSLTFYCTDVSVVFSLFVVLIFFYSANVQLLRFCMIFMEGEVLRTLFWETKAVIRTFAHFLVTQLTSTLRPSTRICPEVMAVELI